MADNALKGVSTRATPQWERTPGRTDEVKNNAGGYVFKLDEWDALDRFLILGTAGGTYYVNERDLTMQNFDRVSKLIAKDGLRVVRRAVEISEAGRAPKNDQAIFTIALASVKGDDATRSAAYDAIPRVCRTATHLYDFLTYRKNLGGVSRGLRRGIASWYKDAEFAAYQAVKYRSRNGWAHRDVLRIAHPKSSDPNLRAVFDFMCGRLTDPDQVPVDLKQIRAFLLAQKASSKAEIVKLIHDAKLPWEAIPDTFINEPEVWEAIIETGIGQTALLRQLPRLTRIGLLKPLGGMTKKVASLITDQGRLINGRIHPVQVLIAMRTYSLGRSLRGNTTWTPVPKITEALDAAFVPSFKTIEPANKRTLIGLDVSGSMAHVGYSLYNEQSIAGGLLSAREASAAMCMAIARTEPEYYIHGFMDRFVDLGITGSMTLNQVINKVSGLDFGATDCAVPMIYARKNKLEVDTFIVFTDNETWYGQIKPFQALKDYRRDSGIDARLIVCGMTATDFTIADPSDKGMLDVVGFDAAAPTIINAFSRGEI